MIQPSASAPIPAPDEVVDDVIGGIRAFDGFGRKTLALEREGIPYLVNEFWTARQRQAHPLHEISYRACFKPQLPGFFIARLTRPGDTVLDPFMGRGTTPVEAALTGRRALGNDVNPLSVMLARPRLTPVDAGAVAGALRAVDWSRGGTGREDLLAFYHPVTLRRIGALRLWLAERLPADDAGQAVDPVADWIRMVALNRLSGHSPGFFSGRSMPPNQAVPVKAQLRINARLGLTPPERDVAALILRKTQSLLRRGGVPAVLPSCGVPAALPSCGVPAVLPSCGVPAAPSSRGVPAAPPRGAHALHTGPAWDMKGVPDGCVDLVVTSPPFLDVVRYADDNWLRCWFAGIDPASVAIDMHRGEAAWTVMARRTLGELARVLRSGGHVAFEVGEVRRGRVFLDTLVWRAAEGLPFDRLAVMVNDQDFTKTAHCWGVGNGSAGTNTNRIVLLRRR